MMENKLDQADYDRQVERLRERASFIEACLAAHRSTVPLRPVERNGDVIANHAELTTHLAKLETLAATIFPKPEPQPTMQPTMNKTSKEATPAKQNLTLTEQCRAAKGGNSPDPVTIDDGLTLTQQ